MLHKAWNSKGEMPYSFPRSSIKFQDHTVQNITDFYPNWAFPDYRPVAAFKSLRFALFIFAWDVTAGGILRTGVLICLVWSAFYSDADQRKHQSSALLAFMKGIHRWLVMVNSPHKGLVMQKIVPFDDIIMLWKLTIFYGITLCIIPQKLEGCHGDCFGCHWGHWSLPSISLVMTGAVILMTFSLECTQLI